MTIEQLEAAWAAWWEKHKVKYSGDAIYSKFFEGATDFYRFLKKIISNEY